MKENLEQAFIDSDNLHASTYSEHNGLILCPTCNVYFDKVESLIRISPNGTILVHNDLLKN